MLLTDAGFLLGLDFLRSGFVSLIALLGLGFSWLAKLCQYCSLPSFLLTMEIPASWAACAILTCIQQHPHYFNQFV